MTAICVDDDSFALDQLTAACRDCAQFGVIKGFASGADALRWLEAASADVALLDIQLGDMDGLQLAARIKERCPGAAVVFVTGFGGYALDAFALHASGYLLKPPAPERLRAELEYALALRRALPETHAHIELRTFGNFDLIVDGRIVNFRRAKAKELLAYLVDRRGSSVTRREAFALLWEESLYDRPRQKLLDVIIRSLRDTLREFGVSEIVELRSGALRVRPELIDCDMYRFIDGDISAVNAYRGEYMSAYSWASLTEGYMDRLRQRGRG